MMSLLPRIRKAYPFRNGNFVVVLNYRQQEMDTDVPAIRFALAGQKAYNTSNGER